MGENANPPVISSIGVGAHNTGTSAMQMAGGLQLHTDSHGYQLCYRLRGSRQRNLSVCVGCLHALVATASVRGAWVTQSSAAAPKSMVQLTV